MWLSLRQEFSLPQRKFRKHLIYNKHTSTKELKISLPMALRRQRQPDFKYVLWHTLNKFQSTPACKTRKRRSLPSTEFLHDLPPYSVYVLVTLKISLTQQSNPTQNSWWTLNLRLHSFKALNLVNSQHTLKNLEKLVPLLPKTIKASWLNEDSWQIYQRHST